MTTLEKAARAHVEEWGMPCNEGELARDLAKFATAALSSALLDPSDEVVRDAAQKLKPWAFARAEDMTDADWELCESERRSACNTARACLRAAGVKITGSQG